MQKLNILEMLVDRGCLSLPDWLYYTILKLEQFVKASVLVVARNTDETENVFYENTVTYSARTIALVESRAIQKLKNMLKRDHPELLAELTTFTVTYET
jgi:hypothetical protein